MSDAREPGEDAYLLALSVLVPVYGGDTREVQLSAARADNDVHALAKQIENCPRGQLAEVACAEALIVVDVIRNRMGGDFFLHDHEAALAIEQFTIEANACEVERRREAEASVQNAITALQHIRALLDAGYYCPKDEVDRALATLRAPVDRQGGLPDE